jgi:hypothetical protein
MSTFTRNTALDLGVCEGSIEVGAEVLYCEKDATHRIAGERDSFGTEWIHMCDTCADDLYDEMERLRQEEERIRQARPCQACKRHDVGNIAQRRSTWDQPWEEPAWLCRACRLAAAREEDREECSYKKKWEPCSCDLGCEQYRVDSFGWILNRIEDGAVVCANCDELVSSARKLVADERAYCEACHTNEEAWPY